MLIKCLKCGNKIEMNHIPCIWFPIKTFTSKWTFLLSFINNASFAKINNKTLCGNCNSNQISITKKWIKTNP